MAAVEVDQSERMEMTGETIVAAANGFTATVRVTARVKQQVRQKLIDRGVKSDMIMIRMFAGAIVLTLRDHLGKSDRVVIDEEYTGHEAAIKSLVLDRARALGLDVPSENILFARVGKRSPRIGRRSESSEDRPEPTANLPWKNCSLCVKPSPG